MAAYPLIADRIESHTKSYSVIWNDQGVNRKDVRRARSEDGNPRQSWNLVHDHISYSEMSTLVNFFVARRGQWDEFEFTDPATATTHSVRFNADALTIEMPLYDRYKISVPIIEVL